MATAPAPMIGLSLDLQTRDFGDRYHQWV